MDNEGAGEDEDMNKLGADLVKKLGRELGRKYRGDQGEIHKYGEQK
jgi:hypothetical protein